LAKHRKSESLEVKDLQLHLGNFISESVYTHSYLYGTIEKNWNILIPGFATEDIRSVRKMTVTPAHQQRMNAVKKAKQITKDLELLEKVNLEETKAQQQNQTQSDAAGPSSIHAPEGVAQGESVASTPQP
jgi:hypothetical protein